jgi:predicted MFS family arabinose efflux permease
MMWGISMSFRLPDFAQSIDLTTANIGVVTGSTVSGWIIEKVGLEGAIGCRLVFNGLSVLSVLVRIGLYRIVDDPAPRVITDAV